MARAKVWTRLRYRGIRTSLRRMLRLMHEGALLAASRAGAPRGPRVHDSTIIPDAVDAMWGTDLTTADTDEGPAAVFVAVDHCSAACIGIHAHARATRTAHRRQTATSARAYRHSALVSSIYQL